MSSSTQGRRYALISPCRDEAQYMRVTLDSVLRQSVPPAIWVIVDDGSTDATPQILAEYAARFEVLRVVSRRDRGARSVGPGVIEAFYAGFETIDLDEFDYIAKLDLDLDVPARYFEHLMERMEREPRIGTCSGKPYFREAVTGRLISELCGDETSVGMIKFYRSTCFQQIGGFVRQVMWDGIDCHRCRMLGWRAVSWDDPELRFIHLRPMGTSQKSVLTGRRRHGFGQYFMGTGFTYLSVSCMYRLLHPPAVAGALASWWGYVGAALRRVARYDDPEFRRFLRRYQWQCLLHGKSRATARLDAEQAAVWSPPVPDADRTARV
ncbi:MAG: glycosyltransferase [Planctomycetota bacterium]